MGENTKAELKEMLMKWNDENDNQDIMGNAMDYLETDGGDDFEITENARELYNAMFAAEDPIEAFSPIDNLLSAIGASAYDSAVGAVARMIGYYAEKLKLLVSGWGEKGFENTPPLQGDEIVAFKKRLDDEHKLMVVRWSHRGRLRLPDDDLPEGFLE